MRVDQPRISRVANVMVSWEEGGKRLRENADIADMSEHGAVLEMSRYPEPGTDVRIIDMQSERTATARVIRGRQEGDGYWVVIAMLRWEAGI